MSYDWVKIMLDYDHELGTFIWISGKRTGKPAGSVQDGYLRIRCQYKNHFAHRLAWFYMYGDMPKDQIDHINGIKTDNRILNLRQASVSENLRNRSRFKSNTSGEKGVTWCSINRKWRSCVIKDRKYVLNKYYNSFDLAVIAVRQARKIHHGCFSNN